MADTRYDPGVDSTPDLAKKAGSVGKLMLDISDSACLCGCRTPTPGRFRPGHDARLKGKLARAAIARVKLVVINDGREREMTARAFAKEVSSDAYDWTVALDRAVEAAKQKAAKMPVKEAVKEAVAETVDKPIPPKSQAKKQAEGDAPAEQETEAKEKEPATV